MFKVLLLMRVSLAAFMLFFTCVCGSGYAFAQSGESQSFQAVYDSAYREMDATLLSRPGGFNAFEHKFDGKINSRADLDAALAEISAAVSGKVLDRKATESFAARRQGGYIGVGVSLKGLDLVGTDGILIEKVIPDSTAADAGLLDGDRIMKVEGVEFYRRSIDDMTAAIQGPEQSMVTLTVLRDGKLLDVAVKRDLDEKIGVELSLDKPYSVFDVRWLNDHGPAAAAGLKEGDVVIAIDGKGAQTMNIDEAVAAMRKPYADMEVKLDVLRDGEPLQISFRTGIVPDWSAYMSFSGQGGGPNDKDLSYNRFEMAFTAFDYDGYGDRLGLFYPKFVQDYPGGVIDLRGSSGSDIGIAVRMIATFSDGQGELLRVKERVDGKETVTVYSKNAAGQIERLRDGKVEIVMTDFVPVVYTGKLVVIVDSGTAGTAEYVVHALQESGRATVVGSSTSGQAFLNRHYQLDAVSSMVYPAQQLLAPDGKTMTAVTPDRGVVIGGNAENTALYELTGESWYKQPDTIFTILLLAAISLFGLVLFASRRKPAGKGGSGSGARMEAVEDTEAVNRMRQMAESGCADGDCECPHAAECDCEDGVCSIDEHRKKLQSKGKSGASPSNAQKAARWWPLALVALMLFGMFVGLPLLNRQVNAPPAGAHSKVTVEFFTDGTAGTLSQKAVIEELSTQYKGDIEFVIVDLSKTPSVAAKSVNGGDIRQLPVVIVTKQWFDAGGKQISMHSSTRGKVPKRELVPMIERAAESMRDGWPATDVTRVTTP
ncbi:MAG: PDZ domain-containing protein [Cyanobacteriota/Melainabacteria group bacterium]